MNITYIGAPIKSNMGNGFFSDGGKYILDKTLNQKHNITNITHNESIKIDKKILNNTDLFILGWGCVLTERNFKRLLQPILNLKKDIIGLGFGCTYYNKQEKDIAINFAKNCKMITTRDNYLYEYIKNYTKCLNAIDSGFFCSEYYDKNQITENYCVSNIDDENVSKTDNAKQIARIQEKYPHHKMYITCNDITNNRHDKNKKFQKIDNCESLWNFYKNAKYVSTTRAHTAICCLTEKTKLEYYGHMDKRALGMFEACGIDLSRNATDTSSAFNKIRERKEKYLNELKEEFKCLNL